MKLKSEANKLCQMALEYYSKGNCKKLLNNYKGAIADFTKAIKYNPNFAEAYYKRAYAKLIINDTKGAKSDYNKAIELNPHFAETFRKGILRMNEGNLKVGEKEFLKVDNID